MVVHVATSLISRVAGLVFDAAGLVDRAVGAVRLELQPDVLKSWPSDQ